MMRSLYSGVSGLRNHQTRMDVIGNNIANVNTIGYKTSRTIFQDVYSQTAKNASAAAENFGGTNPLQIGLGVTLAAVDVLHTASAIQRTDNPMDLMIEGDGFFIVQGIDQLLYTRAGNFYLDAEGNVVTSGGNFVQGKTQHYATDDDITDLENELGLVDGIDYVEETIPDPSDPTGTATIDRYFYTEYIGPIPATPADLANTANYQANLFKPIMAFDEGLTKINCKGYRDIEIDEKGIVRGLTEESKKEIIAYLGIAVFENSAGLKKMGSSQYAETPNSGAALHTIAQNDGAGSVKSGGLEMSNVDLASEFTDMIVTQRGFQANSRVITVSDTLLEELINLKR